MNEIPESGMYEKGKLDFIKVISEALNRDPGKDGIVLYYVGTVKELSKDGKKVKQLYIEAYKELADKKLKEICYDAINRFSTNDCRIYHFYGYFMPGEPLVVAIIWSRDRSQGLSALPYVIERYKKEPTIWKKEIYEDGTSKWLEE
ncbi:MAG: molybdenum cofactor biosynthesis protein MoaE [Nitrososphaeria archaeon]|nr:molybdenum cofactor biosynthesis protein MoaE [Conexivisphaerales archaeon]